VIGFSQCGNYYTLTSSSEIWPAIYPLPVHDTEEEERGLQSQVAIVTEPSRKREADADLQPGRVARRVGLDHVGTLQSNVVNVTGTASKTCTIITKKFTPHKLELHCAKDLRNGEKAGETNTVDSASEAFQLLSVPQDMDLRYTDTTINWPSGREEKIKIILSKSSRPYYDASELQVGPVAAHILYRDQRSLQPLEEGDTPSTGSLRPKLKALSPPIREPFEEYYNNMIH
jgi:hypothetical protein